MKTYAESLKDLEDRLVKWKVELADLHSAFRHLEDEAGSGQIQPQDNKVAGRAADVHRELEKAMKIVEDT